MVSERFRFKLSEIFPVSVMLTRPQLASGFVRPIKPNFNQDRIYQYILCDFLGKSLYKASYVPLSSRILARQRTNLVCRSAIAVDPASPVLITDRNEYRRGVGLCVVNKDGLVFAARYVVVTCTCAVWGLQCCSIEAETKSTNSLAPQFLSCPLRNEQANRRSQ